MAILDYGDDSHAPGPDNVTLESFTYKVEVELGKFREWMRANYPELTHLPEAEWFEQWDSYLSLKG